MKKLILIFGLVLVCMGVQAQVKVENAMPFEYSPGVTTVVTLDFASLPFWQPGELIIIEIPATNTGTVKINTVSATMGANTGTYPAGTKTTIPPLRVDRYLYFQCSVPGDKIIITR